MKRLVAAVALTVLATAVLVTAGGRQVSEAHAATGACTRHTKRVVKHVKLHGKRTRVVHLKHYWTCAEAPAPVAPPVTVPAPVAPAPTPNPLTEAPKLEQLPEPEPNALGVAAEDMGGLRYSLSRQTVRSGRLLIQLANKGEDPHTMDMQRVGPNGELEGPVIAELATEPGEEPHSTTIEVQPGTYRMWCTIGHHAEHGMKAEIVVE